MRSRVAACGPWFGLLLLVVGVAPARAAPVRGWDYEVRLDEGLQHADVRMCFRGLLPIHLVPAAGGLDAFDLSSGDADAARLVPTEDGAQLSAPDLRAGGCVGWRVDLGRLLEGAGRRRDATRVGRDVMLPPGWLFLRPVKWPDDAVVTVKLVLPDGLRAAVPWEPLDGSGRYRLDARALSLDGRVAFGRFPPDTLEVAGTRMDVAVLDAPHAATTEGIHRWLTAAARAVAGLYGRFPSPRVTVLLHPVPSLEGGVLFGESMRAGGSHLHLLLSSSATDDQLPGEWVAVHEMIHLGMPWTQASEAWMQEGFVTYYQEVLRARAGLLTEQQAWQDIHEGFGRGRLRGGEQPLEQESREMGRQHLYWRVYWAGAAIALKLDVELRRRSQGRVTLDDAMRLFHDRFGMRAPQRGLDLLRAFDARLRAPFCAALAERYLQQSAFPDTDALYRDLGLQVQDGRIRLRDDAPLATLRARIMRGPAASDSPGDAR